MGRILKIPFPDISGQPSTTLTSTYAAAGSTLPITDGTAFTSAKYVLIGGWNTPKAEIRLAGTVTATTIPITAATTFDHSAGTIVQQLPYNQVEITYSTDFEGLWESNLYATIQDAAAAATWSTLSSTALTPAQEYTTVKDDSTASRTYRWRFKNSTDTIYSDYIEYLLPDGYEEKSVSAIFRKATGMTNKTISKNDTGQVNEEFLFDTINEGLRIIGQKRKRWSHDQAFEGTITEMTAGVNSYVLPSNIEIRDTNRSTWNIRVADGYNLQYCDKREMDVKQQNWHHSLSASQLTSASSSWTFDDTSNFSDTGTITAIVGTDLMTITYTANNRTTNVLTTPDCATEVTTTIPVDTNVWQGASFGQPMYFTMYDGVIVFDVVLDTDMHQRTIDGDYYLKIQQVKNLYDYVRVADPNILINYLRWGISIKTNNDTKAGQYKAEFTQQILDLKNLETTGQKQKLRPRGWRYRSAYSYAPGAANPS